jgi:hypothetical protein
MAKRSLPQSGGLELLSWALSPRVGFLELWVAVRPHEKKLHLASDANQIPGRIGAPSFCNSIARKASHFSNATFAEPSGLQPYFSGSWTGVSHAETRTLEISSLAVLVANMDAGHARVLSL